MITPIEEKLQLDNIHCDRAEEKLKLYPADVSMRTQQQSLDAWHDFDKLYKKVLIQMWDKAK